MALAILFGLCSIDMTAQKKDTTQIPDSLGFYKKIKHFSYKYKFTTLLFDAMFEVLKNVSMFYV